MTNRTVDNWQRLGTSKTSKKSNQTRKIVTIKAYKKENIIFIGSEFDYDSFWLKNMFIAPAYVFVRDSKKFRKCDKVTIAYIDYGYTRLEKLAIEGIKNDIKFPCKIDFVSIKTISQINSVFNNNREVFKIQDIAFFSHGLPGKIALNYNSSPSIDINKSTINSIVNNSFLANACVYSYACRTGVSQSNEKFSSLSSAAPNLSFAQNFSNKHNVSFYAFYTRTLYKDILFTRDDSSSISSNLRSKRRENMDLDSFNLLGKYEALKHKGIGHTITIRAPVRIPNFFDLIPKGNVGEGVEDYSLWRKGGGMKLPVSGNTPEGLPTGMYQFNPK